MMQRPILRSASVALGTVMAAIVVGAVYVDVQNTSPGKIADVHSQHPDLQGANSCAICHGKPGQTMNEACLDCHEDIGKQLVKKTGFHGQMSTTEANGCAKCHSEHHGKGFAILNQRSFALAGVPDLGLFDHKGLNFELDGKHDELKCNKCHPNGGARLLLTGQKRFLGLDQDCTSCHKDTHKGAHGHDCESCHGQEHPFPKVAEFEHTLAFALAGSHGKAACVDCHKPADSAHSVVELVALRSEPVTQPVEVRDCQTCHTSHHNESFLANVSRELNTDPGNACQHCHPAVHDTFSGPSATLDALLHACSGFTLGKPHDKLKCENCHAGYGKPKEQLADFLGSYPGRHPDSCRSCHGDPHRGQFQLGPFRGVDCLACHERHEFSPSVFTLDHHKRSDYPLVGAHGKTECNKCHLLATKQELEKLPNQFEVSASTRATPDMSRVRVYHDTPSTCKACHNDPHQGQFERGAFRQKDCGECHDEHSFRVPTFTIPRHANTKFALTGAHKAVACGSCHKLPGERRLIPDGSARRPDSLKFEALRKSIGNRHLVSFTSGKKTRATHDDEPRIFNGTPRQCCKCHEDVHNGQFDLPHLPSRLDGNTDCARCHTTDNFREIRAETFDHTLWTGYSLRGNHAKARCTDCHGRTSLPDAAGRTFGRVESRNCQSCHNDPHVGQFGPTEKVNCTQCHVEGESFGKLVFDHQRDSQFKLDREHRNLACSACHKPHPLPGGKTAIRYKPLGTKCGDCHAARGPRRTGGRGRR